MLFNKHNLFQSHPSSLIKSLQLGVIVVMSCFAVAVSQPTLAVTEKATAAVKEIKQKIPVLTVNINKATAEEIAEILNGIGLKKAQKIVEYRAKHGQFKQLEELLSVKGIGEATLTKNRHKLTLK